MQFTLTGSPLSTQHIYKYTCRSGYSNMYMTAEGKALKEQYQWELKSQGAKVLKGELIVMIDFYFSDKRKRDLDNFLKILLDSGKDILWEDDSQIVKLFLSKQHAKEPKVTLEVHQSATLGLKNAL